MSNKLEKAICRLWERKENGILLDVVPHTLHTKDVKAYGRTPQQAGLKIKETKGADYLSDKEETIKEYV